jgi:hypothetical protein
METSLSWLVSVGKSKEQSESIENEEKKKEQLITSIPLFFYGKLEKKHLVKPSNGICIIVLGPYSSPPKKKKKKICYFDLALNCSINVTSLI